MMIAKNGHLSIARARLRSARAAALLIAVAATLAACGPRGGLSDRYVAEKMMWRAQTLHRAMLENPDVATDEMKARLRSSYSEIVRLFPPPAGTAASLSDLERDVAMISGMSRTRLASLATDAGDAAEAQRLYSSVVDSYSFERRLAVEASVALAASHEAAGEVREAADALMAVSERWTPAESREAPPDLRILRAPLLAATSLAAAGLEEPGQALERARGYYDRLLAEWSGTPTARSALATIAESYELEGRWADAIESYRRLEREYGTAETRPSLKLKLGDLYSGMMGDRALASEYYREVEQLDADGPDGATASISLARFDMADGRYEQARGRLQSVLDRFSDDNTLAATAAQHVAMSYEMEGKPDSAIARYGDLASSYPTTLYGLAASLHVAELYSRMGEAAAAGTALDRAAAHYERIIRDYADTPAEMAARGYLITARTEQEDWEGVASLLVETALRRPGDPTSAGMLLRAASIYETKLNDGGAAEAALRTVIETRGGSEAAAEAQAQLDRMKE